ncbi:hypothetical protein EGY19_05300 [Burkholderia multivorans]|uniref:hypothetical protein n=1 Tax=Burkholderia multivorans TaxID=87883 RepID=UPI000F4FC053|nr:hypothetical protein [Burkholderia multivorans]AYY96924.1 hypothetical protein EGY19_05300 [Burkholderia multivorans]
MSTLYAALSDLAEAHFERQQALLDDAQDAAEAALERAAAVVKLDDVLEALAGLNESEQQKIVDAYRDTADRAHFQWLLMTAFEDAFSTAAKRIAEYSGGGRVPARVRLFDEV